MDEQLCDNCDKYRLCEKAGPLHAYRNILVNINRDQAMGRRELSLSLAENCDFYKKCDCKLEM